MRRTKALFVTSTRIGDCVLSSGIIREIGARYPGCEITVACGPLAAPLFRSAPGVSRVHVMAKRPNGGHWLDLWLKAFPTRWDLVVDIRGSAIAWLIPAIERRVYSRRRDEALHKVEAASLLIF
ncbi:MAG TPA: glycosyltransferase family 9 protein, partial [Caulobacteraceae bacterium]